jgi:hypothetical protein
MARGIQYSTVRIDENGKIQDVSLFSGKEYEFAQYVAELEKKIHPTHTVTVEIVFSSCWNHVKKDFLKTQI